jgi:hypothetical protein
MSTKEKAQEQGDAMQVFFHCCGVANASGSGEENQSYLENNVRMRTAERAQAHPVN